MGRLLAQGVTVLLYVRDEGLVQEFFFFFLAMCLSACVVNDESCEW
jgi:hypothetical protein